MNVQSKNAVEAERQTAEDLYPTRLADGEMMTLRKDPVLWSDWDESAPITKSEAEHYAEKGYLVRRDLFSKDEVGVMIETSRKLREQGQRIRAEDLITEPESEAVRTIFRLEEHSDLFDRVARDERMAGLARFLLGDDVYIHQSRLNYKPGFTGKEFYWHSDFETWHAEDGMPRMRAVSASLLLTDNSALNGPLMLIPGSHLTFIGTQGETPDANHESSLKKQEIGVPSQETLKRLAAEAGIDHVEGPAGTVIFFECNTLHGSNGNITPDPRSNAFFVYNAVSNASAEPFAAKSPRPDYLANRGTPKAIQPVKGSFGEA
ncbi:L-proline 4-hydroxylase [Pseudooceanicola batsensis HTCC2597]|uniref:Ectoine hydroxylase n=1 Tax=Pseudooceanicola batsensis (strain ATCC BAA-863 / DSM 15984 / KCTC 12145 / HTCC2597) TaxID=252305 RepID=A3TW74_PSEBH|nr:ectoine hydroxylase [Pseudooceanicola batsensis]EAQ03870.1 L-proline 4-hydroxylase [Pseudooceanicola batsensis HTCC2597]